MEEDHENSPGSHNEDELTSLPKATISKLIQEILPKNFSCGKDAKDLVVDCCVEFIHLIASEANEICEKDNKKTIAPEHVITALDGLGFQDYINELQEVQKEHKDVMKSREKRSTKLAKSGLSEEELAKQQADLFAQARKKLTKDE